MEFFKVIASLYVYLTLFNNPYLHQDL